MALLPTGDVEDISRRVEECYQHAEKILGRFFERPNITFRRSGKNAGAAFLNQNRINLNPVLYVNNPQVFITEVIPHEISHLLVYRLFGKVKPHGKEWQSMMSQVFELEPKTTHSLDLSPLNIKSFEYVCNCRSVELSTHRHNKVLRGKVKYRCKDCGTELTWATHQK